MTLLHAPNEVPAQAVPAAGSASIGVFSLFCTFPEGSGMPTQQTTHFAGHATAASSESFMMCMAPLHVTHEGPVKSSPVAGSSSASVDFPSPFCISPEGPGLPTQQNTQSAAHGTAACI